MIPELGHFLLIMALGVALAQGVLSLAGAQRERIDWMVASRSLTWGQFVLVAVSFALALLEERTGWLTRIGDKPAWVYSGATAATLIAIELFGVTEQSIPFIYFQF